MIFDYYDRFFLFLSKKIDHYSQNKLFVLQLAFACFLFSIIFIAFPPYHVIIFDKYSDYWTPILKQINDPFHPIAYPSESHSAKRCFRLTVPVLAHFLGFKTWGCIAFQTIIGLINIGICYKLFYRITHKDNVSATLLSMSVVGLYVGFGAYYDLRGMFDTISIGFLIYAMYTSNFTLIFLFTILAAFTDERGLIASSLIWLFHSMYKSENGTLSIKVFKIDTPKLALVTAWLSYFAIRYLLTKYYNFYTATGLIGIETVLKQMNNFPLAIWSALEGFWLLVIVGCYYSYKMKHHFFLVLFIGSLALTISTAMSVIDLTRSVMYIFPSVFIAAMFVSENEDRTQLQKISYLIFILCLLFPAYYFYNEDSARWCYPLPFRIIHMIGSVVYNI